MKNRFTKFSFLLLILSFVLIQCKTDDSIATEKTEIKAEIQKTVESITSVSEDTVLTTERRKKTEPIVTPIVPPRPPIDPGGGGCVYPVPDPRPWPPEPPCPPPPIPEPKFEEVVTFADPMPEFPGGVEALMKFISDNIQYPAVDREMSIQGTVYVKFIVEKDGSLSGIKIARGISESLDKEAKRVIRIMPNWIPAKDSMAQPIRCWQTLPIRFILN